MTRTEIHRNFKCPKRGWGSNRMSYRVRDLLASAKKPIGGFITILGLSSLGEGIVKWRDWFNSGVIEHYQEVRNWVFNWLPWDVPIEFRDYAIIWSSLGFLAFWVLQDAQRRMHPDSHDEIVILAINSLVSFVLGPLIVLSILPLPAGPMGKTARGLERIRKMDDPIDSALADLHRIAHDMPAQRRALARALAYLVVCGIVLLFVASDLLK